LLCNVLRPRAVLALTATATPVTRACIRQLLAIPPEQQLIESPLRSNLRLQVAHFNGASKGGGIAAKVVQLLTTGELHPCLVTCSAASVHVLKQVAAAEAVMAALYVCIQLVSSMQSCSLRNGMCA
jgi:superfamily II DNA helicase RecQ